LIAIPLIVGYSVDEFYQPGNIDEGESNYGFHLKFGVSVLMMLFTMKMFQLSHSVIVRKPISSKSSWFYV
jgi:hypothetical protein